MTLEEAIAAALDLDRQGRALNAELLKLMYEHPKIRSLTNAWNRSGSSVWKQVAGELAEAQREMNHER